MGGDRWRVVGGADKGGIVVREGKETSSQQLSERLGFGSVVEELELAGERLRFRKLDGAGPESGWASVKLKDKDLLERVVEPDAPRRLPSPPAQTAPAAQQGGGPSSPGEEWVVAHERVVRRAEASKDSKMMGTEKKGASIRGTVLTVDGVPWLKSPMEWKGDLVDTFVMIDGATVGLGALLERAAPAAAEGNYWVMQGPLFKKASADPGAQKVSRLSRAVGSMIKTTGKTWTGPSGGVWVELDPASEKAGWMLVEGPGFDVPGPLLEKAEPGQEPPLVLKLYSMITSSELCEICVHRAQSIAHVKRWIALRDPHGLKAAKVLVANEMPTEEERGSFSIASFPTHRLHSDAVKVGDTRLKSGDLVPYFYMGEASDDGRFS